MSEEKKDLFNDWSSTKKALLENLDSNKHDLVKNILKGQERYLKQNSAWANEKAAKEQERRDKLTPEQREEEDAEEIIRRLQGITPESDFGEFDRITLPMIRRIIPSTIATDIIGVQPMSLPPSDGGNIYSLKFRFEDKK